ncbi:hypothetical protein CI238_00836 [Colletotrichum incanum]|uniref:Uncharacterized protein n=1 Tax=Colletotrichum incanum TaxID=1573173 RepID=A0A161WLS6_COLIC|nr:hypothetical protein CI238_00836 [Colletotrichum incanum]OHW99585.1 hypothetical protein CSPAE12_01738 [Colletotrichum incanum]
MSASEPNFSFDEPHLALIYQAAKIRAIPTTDSATDLLQSDQVRTFSTFVSHFMAPRKTIVAMARNMDANKRFSWTQTTLMKSPAQHTTNPRLTEMKKSLHASIKGIREESEQMEAPACKKMKMAAPATKRLTTLSIVHVAAKEASTEKPLHLFIKRIRAEAKQMEAPASKQTKLTAPRRMRLTKLSSISVIAEDTSTDNLTQQYRVSDEEMARLGRRHQGPAWKSKSTSTYC